MKFLANTRHETKNAANHKILQKLAKQLPELVEGARTGTCAQAPFGGLGRNRLSGGCYRFGRRVEVDVLLLDFESAFFESAFLERVAADLDLVVFGDAFFAADALGVDLAVKPNFVSNSATRVASLSFSSRAFCAIALTVSNSSRETRSIDSTIRSNCCLILLLASSRAVCNDPIAFVATRAKSSNRRLSVCMSFTCYPFSVGVCTPVIWDVSCNRARTQQLSPLRTAPITSSAPPATINRGFELTRTVWTDVDCDSSGDRLPHPRPRSRVPRLGYPAVGHTLVCSCLYRRIDSRMALRSPLCGLSGSKTID